MYRIFLIKVQKFNYEKKDLNVPFSDKRINIGVLSRMVTNAIFLSHSLREKVIVRVLIEEPVPHIIQIQTNKIRYLGPDERSLASIILKTERKIVEQKNDSLNNHWFQPNPGLFVKITNDWLIDLEPYLNEPVGLIQFNYNSQISDRISQKVIGFSFKDFEEKINNFQEKYNSNVFIFNFKKDDPDRFEPSLVLNAAHHLVKIPKILNPPTLVGIINVILDKRKQKPNTMVSL